MNTFDKNQSVPSDKTGLFAIVGVVLVTALAGGLYYFFQPEDSPPSLTAKTNTYQGITKDAEFEATQWEKSDLKTHEDKKADLKKAGIDISKPLKAEKGRVNILFAAKDTNLQEIMDATSRKEGGRIIFGVFKSDTGQFVTTQNSYFNEKDKKGNKILTIIDSTKQSELEKVTIMAGEAIFVMSDYAPELFLVKSETDVPSSNLPLSYFTKGWHAVAVSSDYLVELLKDVDPATYSIWGTKNNKDFAKILSPADKKTYNNIIWINVKVDKLVKKVTVGQTDAEKKAAEEKAKAEADAKAAADAKAKAEADAKAKADAEAKAAAEKAAELKVSATLNTGSAAAASIIQGTSSVPFAKFDITSNKTVTIKKITFAHTGMGSATDLTKTQIKLSGNVISTTTSFPIVLDNAGLTLNKDTPLTLEVLADISAKATINLPHSIKLTEIDVLDGTTTKTIKADVSGNTMMIMAQPAPTVTIKAIVVAAIDSAQDMPISWTSTDEIQTQYTDTGKTKSTLSYTWKFIEITDPAKPVEKWALTPEWGSKDGETGVLKPENDGTCFQKLYGEDGKELTQRGREWTCTKMTIEKERMEAGKEYKMEIVAFDGERSSAPGSVTFKTKAAVVPAEPVAVVDDLKPTAVAGDTKVTITPNVSTEDAKFYGIKVVATATGETDLSQTLIYDAKPGVVSYTADASSKQIAWIIETKAIEITGLKSEKEYTFKIELLYKTGFKSTVGVKTVTVTTTKAAVNPGLPNYGVISLTTPVIKGPSCSAPGQPENKCYLVIEKPSFYTNKTITNFIIKEDNNETTVTLPDPKITTKTAEDYYLYELTSDNFITYFQSEHTFEVKVKAGAEESGWGTYTYKPL